MSEAFKKFPIWYRAEANADEIARDSNVREVFIFDGDTVTSYLAKNNDFGNVEDFRDLSKEQAIAEVESKAAEIEISISTYEYELMHILNETGNSVEETDFEYREKRSYLVEQKPIVQMLYDNFIVGFQLTLYGRPYRESFFTIVEDGSVRINLGYPEEESKNNISIE